MNIQVNMDEEFLEIALDRALPRIALELQNELRLACKVDKGRLRNSIKCRVSGNSVVIGMVEYGKFFEFGTLPHVIIPNKKQALKFKGNKGDVIVKKVNHPGTRPNPFIRNTLRYKLPRIIISNIVRELNIMAVAQ